MFVLPARRRGGSMIAFAAGGKALAARSDTGLQLWRDPAPGAKPTVFPSLDAVGYLQFSPDASRLYVGGRHTGVIDVAAGEFESFPVLTGYRFAALTADGQSLLVIDQPHGGKSTIDCWPADRPFRGKPRWRTKFPRPFAGRQMPLADGRFANLEREDGDENYRLTVRSGEKGKLLAERVLDAWYPDREAVSPCGRWLAGLKDTRLAVWSLDDLAAPPVEWRSDSRKVFTDLAFHPSGRFLAVTANDETVKLHDTTTWKVVKTYTWDVGKMKGIAFTPEGTLAAAGGDAGHVVVWDVDVCAERPG